MQVKKTERNFTRMIRHLGDIKNLEDALQLVAQQGSDAIGIVSATGVVVYASQTIRSVTEAETVRATAESVFAHIHPDDLTKVKADFDRLISHAEATHMEFRFRNSQGQFVDLSVLAIPLISANQEVHHVLAVSKNITDRKITELKLNESEQRYRSLVEQHPDAVFTIDMSGRFTDTNEGCGKLTGYEYRGLHGLYFTDILLEDDHHLAQSHFRFALRGKVQHHELRIRHKLGHIVNIQIITMPMTSNGEVIGVYGIAQDITHRKQFQQLLTKQNAVLKLLASDEPLAQLLKATSEIVEELLPDKRCAILLLNKAGQLQYEVSENLPSEYMQACDAPQITAALTNSKRDAASITITEDIWSDPRWDTHIAWAKQYNVRSCWSTPIRSKDRVLGVLAIYASVPAKPSDYDREVIDKFSDLVGLAIARHQDHQEIRHVANFDPLTGAANQRLLTKTFVSLTTTPGARVAIIYLDLDQFENINQEIGHLRADEYLRKKIKQLDNYIGDYGLISRIGGDAFACILTDWTDADEVWQRAHRLRQLAEEYMVLDGKEISTTISQGIAIYPEDGKTLDKLLRNAESAMIEAKRRGKGEIFQFIPFINQSQQERLALIHDMRRALRKSEFFLEYQPRVDLRTGTLVGCEALIRWQHPTKGIIPPMEFIPLAEENGFIREIGLWVVRESCRTLRMWNASGFPPIRVGVNFSPRQFQDRNLAGKVLNILEEENIDPRQFDIEITESVLMKDDDRVASDLKRFQDVGIQVCIDDFGTGYSSIGFLRKFPLNCIKIDQSFVRDIGQSSKFSVLVPSIIQLANLLGMRVIAEGVETTQQVEFLREHNCDEIQGYYISRPIPVDQFTVALEKEAFPIRS